MHLPALSIVCCAGRRCWGTEADVCTWGMTVATGEGSPSGLGQNPANPPQRLISTGVTEHNVHTHRLHLTFLSIYIIQGIRRKGDNNEELQEEQEQEQEDIVSCKLAQRVKTNRTYGLLICYRGPQAASTEHR